jgi:ATP-dependent Clp protease ATP-binding subunit ClpA
MSNSSEVIEVENNDVLDTLENKFSTEFVSRMDECVYFNELNEKDLLTISKLKLEITKQILQEKNIHIDFDKKILHYILKKASCTNNKAFITRNIPKVIQKYILEPIAEQILKTPSLNCINISIYKDEIRFQKT